MILSPCVIIPPIQPQMVTEGVYRVRILSASAAGPPYTLISNGIAAGVGLLRALDLDSAPIHGERGTSSLRPAC